MGKTDNEESVHHGKSLLVLSLTTIGVVYGDIGTSPIYAIRESFYSSYGLSATPPNVFGVLSLIFWSLILVISVKYPVMDFGVLVIGPRQSREWLSGEKSYLPGCHGMHVGQPHISAYRRIGW
jgi:hypothetical protein